MIYIFNFANPLFFQIDHNLNRKSSIRHNLHNLHLHRISNLFFLGQQMLQR